MIEDSEMQKSYIDELKQDHKLFLEEVSQREEDLNKQLCNTEMKYIEKIDSQNEIIIQMNKEIREVKKNNNQLQELQANETLEKKLVEKINNLCETIPILEKEIMSFRNTNVELRQKIKTQEDYVQKLENYVLELNYINKNMIISIRALEEENRNLAASIETLKSIVRSLEEKDKSFKCLDVSEVNVEKIPLSSPMNAELSRSIEYNKKTKIIIFCDETGYGLGKTFSQIYVPYCRNYKVNEMIYRSNIKLNDYAIKLNHYAEGNIYFLDINYSEGNLLSKAAILKKISESNVLRKTGIQSEICAYT
ncbi:hypothetical protein JTB14_020614 [Gonioctena quinquepunctata]|nr:hypothetical protein JTB14_020614 [Gonioctena quinquepunctata]